jgi:hypothetical protein
LKIKAARAALRINLNVEPEGCGIVAAPVHAPSRALLLPLLLLHNLPLPRVHLCVMGRLVHTGLRSRLVVSLSTCPAGGAKAALPEDRFPKRATVPLLSAHSDFPVFVCVCVCLLLQYLFQLGQAVGVGGGRWVTLCNICSLETYRTQPRRARPAQAPQQCHTLRLGG